MKKQKRNDKCSCNSGLKYKKCCIKIEENKKIEYKEPIEIEYIEEKPIEEKPLEIYAHSFNILRIPQDMPMYPNLYPFF